MQVIETAMSRSRTVILSLIVVLIVGLFAYMTIGGIIGPVRQSAIAGTAIGLQDMGMETQGIDAILAAMTGAAASTVNLVVTVVIAGAVLVYCFLDNIVFYHTSEIVYLCYFVVYIDVAHGTGVTLRYAHNVINCVQNITKAASRVKRSHYSSNVIISKILYLLC